MILPLANLYPLFFTFAMTWEGEGGREKTGAGGRGEEKKKARGEVRSDKNRGGEGREGGDHGKSNREAAGKWVRVELARAQQRQGPPGFYITTRTNRRCEPRSLAARWWW
jgi:hypothetical protein